MTYDVWCVQFSGLEDGLTKEADAQTQAYTSQVCIGSSCNSVKLTFYALRVIRVITI